MHFIMRKQWKPEDIFGGLYIIRETSPFGSANLGFARTVTFKIGYDNRNLKAHYGKMNCLTDGWYNEIGNDKQSVADYLNADLNGYRKLTKAEYIAMINYSDQGFTDNF